MLSEWLLKHMHPTCHFSDSPLPVTSKGAWASSSGLRGLATHKVPPRRSAEFSPSPLLSLPFLSHRRGTLIQTPAPPTPGPQSQRGSKPGGPVSRPPSPLDARATGRCHPGWTATLGPYCREHEPRKQLTISLAASENRERHFLRTGANGLSFVPATRL